MTGPLFINEVWQKFFAREPTSTEIEVFVKRCEQNEHSWCRIDDRIFTDTVWKRPHLVIYSSCHVNQIMIYLEEYRRDVLDKYYVSAVLCHQLQLDCKPEQRELFDRIFATAEVVFCNVLPDKFGWTATSTFLKNCRPDTKVISFVPPTCAAFWPVCTPFGEDGVISHMRDGLNANGIIDLFRKGAFRPCFEKRFEEQLSNLALRETPRDVKLSDFYRRRHKTHKVQFTFNHATFHVISYIVEQFLKCLGGIEARDEDWCLSLPTNGARMGSHFPESSYEFDYYNFAYPMRYLDDRGGTAAFYANEIRQSYTKQRALLDRGEADYLNPEDDL